MTTIKKRSIIDFVKDLTERKTPWEKLSDMDQKAFTPYIINLWLSMNPDLIEFVNELQQYTIGQLSPKQVYKLYLGLLPKMKLPYSKYIKGKKSDKYNKQLLELVANHFYISQTVAEDYIDLIPKERMVEIITMYGKNSKEIKKLMK